MTAADSDLISTEGVGSGARLHDGGKITHGTGLGDGKSNPRA